MQSIRKFNYKNHPMNLPQKGLGDFLNKNKSGVSAAGGVAAGMVDTLNPESKLGGDIASGALKGAAAGMAFGPWGAAAGAVIGGAVSIFTHKADERKAERAELAQLELQRVTNNDASRAILQNFNTSGINRPRAGKGGRIKDILSSPKILSGQAEYLAEDGEVIEYNPGQVPATDKFGKLNPINSTSSLIRGAKHSSPSEGVGMTGGERIFSNDDKLKVPKHFEKLLKKL